MCRLLVINLLYACFCLSISHHERLKFLRQHNWRLRLIVGFLWQHQHMERTVRHLTSRKQFTVFWRVRKIVESDYWLRHVCPSVRPHLTARLPLDGFSWSLIFVYFPKYLSRNFKFLSNCFISLYVPFSVFCVMFLCECVLYCCHRVSTKCVLYCCHQVSTQLQLNVHICINVYIYNIISNYISYHIS
jgi:hypothetical protein